MKRQRAKWLQHIVRLPDDRWVKIILMGGVVGNRRRDRLREKWSDGLCDVEVRNWKVGVKVAKKSKNPGSQRLRKKWTQLNR